MHFCFGTTQFRMWNRDSLARRGDPSRNYYTTRKIWPPPRYNTLPAGA